MYMYVIVIGGTVTSCARIRIKQIYPVSVESDFLADEVSNHLGLYPDFSEKVSLEGVSFLFFIFC